MRTRKQSGLTLLEVIVMMCIIGLLAAIAIANFLDQKKQEKGWQAHKEEVGQDLGKKWKERNCLAFHDKAVLLEGSGSSDFEKVELYQILYEACIAQPKTPE